jgi:hypothetical protein
VAEEVVFPEPPELVLVFVEVVSVGAAGVVMVNTADWLDRFWAASKA